MRFSLVKTAIWHGERLFVVEDVPAHVCDSCYEQFYDDMTTDSIRRLTEDGFPAAKAKREILVPVFSLDGGIEPKTEASLVTEESR
jgi:YgiT-type zinc finger domain-containing protein